MAATPGRGPHRQCGRRTCRRLGRSRGLPSCVRHSLWGVILSLAPLTAAAELPPEIGFLFPSGGRAGETLPVILGGYDATADMEILPRDPGVRIEITGAPSRVLIPDPPHLFGYKARANDRPCPREFPARLTLPADLAPGLHRFWIANANGVSPPGVFHVSRFPAVVEERALADLWQRTTPIIAEESGYDPNRDSGDIAARSSVKTTVNPLAFLVGPVEVVYGGDQARSKVAELSRYIDAANGTIHSLTGELTLNTRKNFCTLDAPKAQGVTGFFEQQKQFELRDVTIRTGNHYGAVLVVALDNKPLKESGKVLIQVGTQCRPTGWQEEPVAIKTQEGKIIDGFRVVNYGRAPWQVIQANVAVTIRNTGLKKATALDMNGNATGNVALDRNTGNVSLKFPAATMYLILE